MTGHVLLSGGLGVAVASSVGLAWARTSALPGARAAATADELDAAIGRGHLYDRGGAILVGAGVALGIVAIIAYASGP